MADHREALCEIMRMCGESRTYTRRIQAINNVAMRALGMTYNQRHAEHMRILTLIGDNPSKTAYEKRKAQRDAKYPNLAELEESTQS